MVNAIYPGTDHRVDHQNGGVQEIDVTGLSGLLADNQTPAVHATAKHDASVCKKGVTFIDFSDALQNAKSGAAYAALPSRVPCDFDNFDEVASIYFFAVLEQTAGAGPWDGYAELYNATDTASIAGSEVTQANMAQWDMAYLVSGDIKAAFPSGLKWFSVRLHAEAGGGTIGCYNAGIMIVWDEA